MRVEVKLYVGMNISIAAAGARAFGRRINRGFESIDFYDARTKARMKAAYYARHYRGARLYMRIELQCLEQYS